MRHMGGLQTVVAVVKLGHHQLQRPRRVPGEGGGGEGGAGGRGVDLPREGGDLDSVVPRAGALEIRQVTFLTKSLAEIIELHHAPALISSWPLRCCRITSHVGFESLSLYCWYHEAAAVIPLHRHHANCHFVHSVRSYRADV